MGDREELEIFLEYLKQNQGCDLTVYKHSTLQRRLGVRMRQIGVNTYHSYIDYFKHHSEELSILLDTIFINFTGFFRDFDAWEYLANQVIPKIISRKKPHEPIRIWSASCASGEEAYTLALLFAEALGIEQYLQQVQIYATDVDEAALRQARQHCYTISEVAGVPPAFLDKYFESTSQGYVFNPTLRRRVIFARHNLLEDAPISKLDLLVCRNTLMYFNPEAQVKILIRFHFALKNLGFIFLGKAETLVSRSFLFTPVSIKHRIFSKGAKLESNDVLMLSNKPSQKNTDILIESKDLWQSAFETNPIAQLIVAPNNKLIGVNKSARNLLNMSANDLGNPLPTLPLVTQFGELNTQVEQTLQNRSSVSIKNAQWSTATRVYKLDIDIVPISDSNCRLLGATIIFKSVTN
ncbi:CheR family methyltransferase [Synechocystis sp. PCC 7509]|uniref:CheR family methyltransferase n=1 Tax=Synechocystis sp. PCC 7509 TaxID=927677 RepID=UPI0002ACE411|nr:protein-glutamate O-methyltransferase CheR [Synechocystis sp. PCC 7509]